ncbi:MAG: HalX domain-containing protein [Halobacteriales archaeon]
MSEGTTRTVLVVDDEPNVAEAYSLWLTDEYTVRTATGGEAALEELDETVDVVLLDRRMPDLTGDEVLERIREGGFSCRVAMVTAVDPDFDIVDMAFDAYLVKPVTQEELNETVQRLLRLSTYDQQSQEYFSLAARRATLEAEKTDRELESSDEYATLTTEIDQLQAEMDATIEELDTSDFETMFQDLSEGE